MSSLTKRRLSVKRIVQLVVALASPLIAVGADSIPLRVDWPDKAATEAFPVYSGVSFPKGAVSSVRQVAVFDGEGRPVAASVEPLAKWTPDPSLKWAGVRFPASPGRRYVARILDAEAAGPDGGLAISETGHSLRIDTGAAVFEAPKSGALIGKVEVSGRVVATGGEGCLVLKDHRGRTATESGGEPVIEFRDAGYAVLRREGELLTAEGERLGAFVVRLEFFAGSALVRVQHTFVNTGDTNELQYADLSFRLKPAAAGEWRAAFEPEPGGAPVETRLDPAKGDSAYLLQAEYPHHGQKTYRRELKASRGGGGFEGLGEAADVAGNWASVRTEAGGIFVAMPNLAKLFPKELEVGGDGLTAHLWSSRGGRLLDYRASNLVDHWGVEWVDKQFPGGSQAMRQVDTNAQGSARTHDFWLGFFGPDSAAAGAALARTCANPPHCVQDPAWLRATGAMGFIHPHDPGRFPEMERFLEHFFDEYLAGQAERWGDFGFLDHGCGPHTYNAKSALPGTTQPRLNYRYSGMMYLGQTALWQAYARSGQRKYRDYTEAFHRHYSDYKFVHAETPKEPRGAQRGSGGGEENPYYWVGHIIQGSGVLGGHQGRDLEGFLLQHYLTGDRWGLENALRFGEVFLRDFDPGILPDIGANSNGAQPMLAAAALYQHTGDERYLRKLEAIREKMVDLRTGTAWADVEYYGAYEKYPIKVDGILSDWLASGTELPRQAFEKASRLWLRRVPERGTGYQDQDGRFGNHAWRLTGDLGFAEFVEERFDRVLYEYADAAGRFRNVSAVRGAPHQGGTHGFNFFETAFYGMDLLAATEGKRRPYIALDRGGSGRPVEFWFRKDWHEAVTLELGAAAHPDLQLAWTPEEKNRPGRDYHGMAIRWESFPSYYSQDAPGLGGGFVRAELGPETRAGEYRLTNIDRVYRHGAKKLVMVAPDGLILPGNVSRPPEWFFGIPADQPGSIFANKPVRLSIEGSDVPVAPGQWTELPRADAGRMAKLTAHGLVFVQFRGGIPPVLAQHDPGLYFVPREVQQLLEAAPALPSAGPDANGYLAGLTGKPGDRALSLSGNRRLQIPRGDPKPGGGYANIDYREGTLEFWFRPNWSTGGAAADDEKYFITGGFWPVTIRHSIGDEDDPKMASMIKFAAPSTQAPPAGSPRGYPAQDLRNPAPVTDGRWHHLAISWTTDADRGWLSELYVDGQPALGWARHNVGLGRFLESEHAKFYPPKPWPVDEPRGEQIIILGSVLDAAIDELRISSTARYPEPFPKPRQRSLPMDEDTLLLMRFDGDESITTNEGTQ